MAGCARISGFTRTLLLKKTASNQKNKKKFSYFKTKIQGSLFT